MSKKILAIICASVLAVSALAGCGCKKNDDAEQETNQTETVGETQETPAAVQETHITPTMWYLVSSSDANLEAEKALAEEVQNEYGDRVVIQVINIDENDQMAMLTNVTSNETPAALMLDETGSTSGNSPVVFHCETKEQIIEVLNSGL